MFDAILTAVAAARAPGERVRAQAMLENAACAARLSSMADLHERAHAVDGSADREQWRCDNWTSVCAQIGAAQTLTSGMVNALLINAVTLRERLPKVGAVFAEGVITYLLVRTICQRTGLVKDPAALRAIDADLAAELRCWGAKSLTQTDNDIDALVLRHDPYAVRRTEGTAQTCHAQVFYDGEVAHLSATLTAADGKAVDARMDALARTVCDRDPRTHQQRRAAAQGAMGFGWDRLPCMCEHPDCDAAAKPVGGGVVIHVVAREDAIDNASAEKSAPAPAPEPSPVPQPDAKPEADPVPEPDAESGPVAPATGDLTAQRRRLVGERGPLLSNPLRSYTIPRLIAELEADPGEFCPSSPGVILGGPVLSAPLIAQAAMHASIRRVIHPGQAPPESRYRPSRQLADFVRARDLTCRAPGCTRPATVCQIDHVVPWPYGPTAAANLACLCMEHHLLKTFWPGWSYTLSPDGTAVWTDPDCQTATTQPGSRMLFPELCTATAPVALRGTPPPKHTAGLTMPKRAVTRRQAREHRVDAQRRANTDAAEQYLRACIPPF